MSILFSLLWSVNGIMVMSQNILTSCSIVGLGNRVMIKLVFLWSSCWSPSSSYVWKFPIHYFWFLTSKCRCLFRYCIIQAFWIELQHPTDIVWQSPSPDTGRHKLWGSAFDHAKYTQSSHPYLSFWVYICQNWHISLHPWACIYQLHPLGPLAQIMIWLRCETLPWILLKQLHWVVFN